jgi:uncharacterized protein YebE (UPF0316 family)
MLLLAYFIVGFLQDMLATIDVKAVYLNKPYLSASMGWINTILGYTVFYSIIIGPDFIAGLLCYATGGFIGTVFAMKKMRKSK